MENINSNGIENPGGMGMRRAPGEEMRQYSDGTKTTFGFTVPPQEPFDSEEMRGSMQQALAENIGEYVVVEFLIGTAMIMRKQGILYHVGRSYVTLFDDAVRNFIVCDIFSIKFVYFYFPGDRPKRNYNTLPAITQNGASPR